MNAIEAITEAIQKRLTEIGATIEAVLVWWPDEVPGPDHEVGRKPDSLAAWAVTDCGLVRVSTMVDRWKRLEGGTLSLTPWRDVRFQTTADGFPEEGRDSKGWTFTLNGEPMAENTVDRKSVPAFVAAVLRHLQD
jgi:hypothetical protein